MGIRRWRQGGYGKGGKKMGLDERWMDEEGVVSEGIHGYEENGYEMEVAMHWGFTCACMKWTRRLGREMNIGNRHDNGFWQV